MSKKILFMSSAKLTTLSIGLLLAVFCTIGMSFTPAEEGDNVGNPSDSTYVSGPRRAHWTTSGTCGTTTYNNAIDYGKVVVTVVDGTGGTISVSGDNSNSATTDNNSTAATITWNCGYASTGQKKDLTAKHTNNITFTAYKQSGYNFLGWYEDEECTIIKSAELSYTETFTIAHDSYSSRNEEYESSSKPQTWYRYAKFVEIVPVDLTFVAPGDGGQYTVTIDGNSSTVSSSNITKTGVTSAVTLSATPALGYVFAGWYMIEGGNISDLSANATYSKTFASDATIGARFISTTTQKFKNITKNIEYYGLKAALTAASANDVIIPVAEETVVDGSDLVPGDNGNYTIPSNVKLLIPYESGNTWQTSPKVVTSAATLSVYKKLILMDGVNIVVSSGAQICIGGQAMAGSGGSPTGYTTGACGVLDMSRGGHLELNDGSTLYCWGFVKGQDMDQGNNTVGVGTITVNSGATVWETFSVGDWRGGSATSEINKTRFFPFQSYFMQNIEVPTTYWHESSEWCYFVLNATGGPYDTQFKVIGNSNCLFKLTDAQSKVRKWYDPTTDLSCYELSGTAILDELKIKITGIPLVGTIDIQSSQFDLPIPSNMHLILADCTMNLTKPLVIQPGAIVEIKNDATVSLSTNLYLYDKDEWGPWVCGKYFKATSNLTTHKNRGDGSTNDLLDDAKFIIDGHFTISSSGKLFSTAGGAALVGNGGGTLTYPSALSGSSSLKWYKSTTTSGEGETGTVAVNNANPCNEDGSYTKAIVSKTFLNINGRWFNQTDSASTINADHTYNFTYIASGAVSGTGGTDVSPNTHNAVYAPDKTGLTAGMKWCNVAQDATCSNFYNATQSLNGTAAADIRYTYPSSEWLQLLRTETEGVYGGSDNSLYAVDGCTITSLGSVDENCMYEIGGVKKALVDGHFVALAKNTEDEAWHNTEDETDYYICFEGCNWHDADKYAGEEKAYIVEESNYIWYNNDWLLVEREDPFFFDYNDQNVKRYYEYENGEWVLATPRVRVVDAIETREFYKLPEAITVASGKKNTTITILKDVSGIHTEMTFTASNTTCTLDLNGHTVSGSCAKLLTINASGTTFTITDSSEGKNGRLENIYDYNGQVYNVTLTAGTLNLQAGTIYVENTAQYASKAATVNGVDVTALTANQARGIQVAAGQRLNMTGGRVESHATRYAYGVLGTGVAANTTVLNISGGEIYAEAPAYVYGVNCSGKLYVTGGTITAKMNTNLVDASYAADNASYNLNVHRYCYGINMTASANATASSCYFGTLTMTGGEVNASSDLARRYDSYVYGVRIARSETGAGNNKTGADGTKTQQANAKASISNATINATSAGGYVYGVMVEGSYNSYDKTHSVVTIQNSTITSKGNYYAYGVLANASVNGSWGSCVAADVELTNDIVLAETTVGEAAYGVYSVSASNTVYQNNATYYAGEYAIGAKLTVHSGSYTGKSKTYYAFAAVSSTRSKTTYGSGSSVATERTRGGNAEAYAELIIHGGTFRGEATTTASRAVSSGGITTIDGGTFEAYSTSTTAYGLYAVSGKLTATGVTVTASATGTAYGAFADCAIPSGNTAQTGFAYAGELELNNCNVTATTRTSTEARGVFVNATNKLHNWTQFITDSTSYTSTWAADKYNYAAIYKQVFPCTVEGRDSVGIAIAGKATINGGTITATAATNTAYGVYTVNSFSANLDSIATPDLVVRNCSIDVKTNGTTSATGIYAQGETTIDGCDITVQPKTTTGYGIMALNYQDTVRVTNTTIHVTTTHPTSSSSAANAYGLYGQVNINATNGLARHGNFVLGDGNVVNTTVTMGTTAYAIYLQATKLAITTTGGANRPGDYATAATAIINGGEYNATAASSAYIISLSAKQTQGSVVAQPEVMVNNGYFNGATAEVGTAGVVGHMQLKGGYFVHPTNLATYAVAPKSVWTLPTTHEHYDPYKYKVTEHYTITFMNGETQLQQDDLEAGTSPSYSGTPTKQQDADYTYTFDGWATSVGGDKKYGPTELPTVEGAATYYAHFAKTYRGTLIDVISWTFDSIYASTVTLNMNGYTPSGWKITVADGICPYTKGYKVAGDRNDDRTLTLEIRELLLVSGATLTVIGKDNHDNEVHTYNFKVPYLVTDAYTINPGFTDAERVIWVRDGGHLIIDGEVTVGTIYIDPKAKLTINSAKQLTVLKRLVLRTTTWEAAELVNNGTLNITGEMFYTRQANDRKYHQLALPYKVAMSDVFSSHGRDIAYGSWILKEYDSDARAQYGTAGEDGNGNWKLLDADDTIQASTGYEFYSNNAYYREYYFPITYVKHDKGPDTKVAVYTHGGDAADNNIVHANWNFICTPFTSTYISNDALPLVTISEMVDDDGTYWQHVVDASHPLPTARPFYYQAGANGHLVFADHISFEPNAPASAPARADGQRETSLQWIRLRVTDNNAEDASTRAHSDEMSILFSSRYTAAYEIGSDVEKLFSQGERPQVYAHLACGKLTTSAVPDDITAIPLGIYTPDAGLYTISIDANRWQDRLEHVWLLDNETGTTHDLLFSPFLYASEGRLLTSRFVLMPVLSADNAQHDTDDSDTPTNVDDLSGESDIRVNVNGGQISISGVTSGMSVMLYDATGKLIAKHEGKSADEIHINVSAAGIYMLRYGGTTRRLIVAK